MRQHTMLFVSLVAGTVLFASACSDTTQPTPSSDDKVGFDPSSNPTIPSPSSATFPDSAASSSIGKAFRRSISGTCRPGPRWSVLSGPWLASQGLGAAALRVRRADYDWASLERWQGRATGTALAMRGAVSVDADEARNRVTIGVERGMPMAQVRSAVARLGVPSAAVVVEEVEPVRLAATLQDRVRPVVGALQINFDPDPGAPGSFVCTLGFNATRNGQRSFITNSHCTNIQGGVESTPYWQPTRGVAPTRIATEVADPAYTTGGSCPPGRRCRRSDAARARYASGTTSTLRQDRADQRREQRLAHDHRQFHDHGGRQRQLLGSRCTRSGGQLAGPGGRSGAPASTPTSMGPTSPSSARRWSRRASGPGDSGSPVFRRQGTGSNVTLLGILWGGSILPDGSSLYIFSPISNIETELGALTTF